jgi:hypothetical protein
MRLLVRKVMPTTGKRDSKAMLEFQMTFGISSPDCNALFTPRKSSSSNAVIRAAADLLP